MCDHCSADPVKKKNAKDGAIYRAKQLEKMAQIERGLANGSLKPHDEKNGGSALARSLLRYLVEDWI